MPLYYYQSTNTGAPSLDGQAGSLLAVLQAIFQDGYNFQSPSSITSSGTTATVTCTSHGFADGQVVAHSGADQSEYNVTKPISIIDVDSYTYLLDSDPVDDVATGTFSASVASLGWTALYSDGSSQTTFIHFLGGAYLAVDDSGTTDARVRGFESASGYGVAEASGSGPFPLDADVSGGLYVLKSATADSTPREWFAVSDGYYIHLAVQHSTGVSARFGFGLFPSFQAGDAYNYLIEASSSSANTSDHESYWLNPTGASATSCYAMRGGDQLTGAPAYARASFCGAGGTRMGGSGFTYPAPNRGGLVLDRVMLREVGSSDDFRGWVPGLWNILHNRPYADGDFFSGVFGSALQNCVFRYLDGDAGGPSSAALEYTFGFNDAWTTAGTP